MWRDVFYVCACESAALFIGMYTTHEQIDGQRANRHIEILNAFDSVDSNNIFQEFAYAHNFLA